MFERAQSAHRKTSSVFAWIGFALMIGSFLWLQFRPPREQAPVGNEEPARPPPPFALVVIDPGHGGQDSGSMKAGIPEKDLTLDVAQRVERLLQERGLATLLTRKDDSYVPLSNRSDIGNQQEDCVFVSIHFDDARPAASGIETYYAAHPVTGVSRIASWLPFLQRASSEPPNLESQSLAGFIQEALVARTQAVNRGTRPEQFFVIANVRHPAVLIEGGFLTNKDEKNKLSTPDYREQIAAAICDGITHYREILQQQTTALAVDLPGVNSEETKPSKLSHR